MIKILKNPMNKIFYKLCYTSTNKIRLCAPFVKYDVINNIINNKKDTAKISLITNVNLNNLYKRASDIKAIEKMVQINNYIYNRTNLHAKYYVFDETKAIITSGNLTTNGLKRNYEYGILTNEPALIENIISDYDFLCTDKLTGKITMDKVNQIQRILLNIKDTYKQLPSEEDMLIKDIDNVYQNDINPIINNLKGWKKDVFIEINKLNISNFSTADFNKFTVPLKKQHPENHHINDKIRQVLQQLRDIGLIEFTYRGNYKRLWKNGD